METLSSREKIVAMAGDEDLSEMSESDIMNSANLLQQWGFGDVRCHNCGVLNSDCQGLLMQCAKCKKVYYCSSQCFNEHLAVHRTFCITGSFAHRNPKPLADRDGFENSESGVDAEASERSTSSIRRSSRQSGRSHRGAKRKTGKKKRTNTFVEGTDPNVEEEKGKKKSAKRKSSSNRGKSRKGEEDTSSSSPDMELEYVYEHVPPDRPDDKSDVSVDEMLLVVYAGKTNDKEAYENQKKAFEMLDGNEVLYDAIDATAPEEKERCDKLFEMSGQSTCFPQFFRTTADGDADFVGGWDDFAGALEGDSSSDSPGDQASDTEDDDASLKFSNKTVHRKASIWVPTNAPNIIVLESDEEEEEKDDKRPSCPVRKDTGDSESFLVLYTSGPEDKDELLNQRKMVGILGGNDVRYDLLDGMNPSTADTRDALFDLSGKKDIYPQFFKGESDGRIQFWGGYSDFEKAAKEGSLAPPRKTKRRRNRSGGQKRLTLPLETLVEETEDDLLEFDDSDLKALQRPTDQDNCADSRPKRPVRRNSDIEETLLVLYASRTKSSEELTKQMMMTGLLEDCDVTYQALDGKDPKNSEKRDELFQISGRKDEYPQFFSVGPDGTKFWGGWDEFEEASRDGGGDLFAWDWWDDEGEGTKRRRRRSRRRRKKRDVSLDRSNSSKSLNNDPERDIPRKPQRVPSNDKEVAQMGLPDLTHSEIDPDWDVERLSLTLREAEIVKKDYSWEKPEWVRNYPFKRHSFTEPRSIVGVQHDYLEDSLLASRHSLRKAHATRIVEDLCPPSPEFDRDNMALNHAEIQKSSVEWEIPEWARKSPLRKTSKGQLLQEQGDFGGFRHPPKSPEREPEWVVKSPLRRSKSTELSLGMPKSLPLS